MRKFSRELQGVSGMLDIFVRDWYKRLPINSAYSETPIRVDVEHVVLRIEGQFPEEGFPTHDKDEIPDPVGFAWEILRKFMLMKKLISCGKPRIHVDQGSKEASWSKSCKSPWYINRCRLLLDKFFPRKGVENEIRNAHVVPNTGPKEIEDLPYSWCRV